MKRLYIICLSLSLLLFFWERVFELGAVRSVPRKALFPLSHGVYQTGVYGEEFFNFVKQIPVVYRENKDLRQQVTRLKTQLVELDSLKKQNQALREQLGVKSLKAPEKVMASVLGRVQQGESVVYIIDKGEDGGIKPGDIAVTGRQLVGRVTEVYGNSSFVLPVMAVKSRIPVEVVPANQSESGRPSQRKARGIVKGEFNRQLVLTEVLQKFELREGDLVLSSGEGGVYPAGLLIGEVREVKSQDNALFKQADLKALWDPAQLQSVFLW